VKLTDLSGWQRIKRKVCLSGGSYTWPDGYLELDIDDKAGVRRDDAEEVKDLLLDRHISREAARERFWLKVAVPCFAVVALIYWFTHSN
jgi:hypothetical protein